MWVSFDCALAGATALSAISLPGELQALGVSAGRATAALIAWDEAVIHAVLSAANEKQNGETALEWARDEIWGRAWAGNPYIWKR